MDRVEHNKLAYFLAEMKLQPLIAAYTRVPPTWQDLDFVPDFARFYYIREGEGVLRVGDYEFNPQPGQLVLLPSKVRQSYSAVNDHTYLKYWCHFNAAIGEMNFFQAVHLPYWVEVDEPDELERLFVQLIQASHSEEFTAMYKQKAALAAIFAYYLDRVKPGTVALASNAATEKMEQVLQYIETHLADNITLEQLARLVHLHPNYFVSSFKMMLGDPPIQYIKKLRIEKAKRLLLTTNRPVGEIADEVGVQLFYFSRVFKQLTGMSPTEFRSMIDPVLREEASKV